MHSVYPDKIHEFRKIAGKILQKPSESVIKFQNAFYVGCSLNNKSECGVFFAVELATVSPVFFYILYYYTAQASLAFLVKLVYFV